jgi:hypothetical protein
MATPAQVRAYGQMGGAAPPDPVQHPYVPTQYASLDDDAVDEIASFYAYNMGYTRALDTAQRHARQAAFAPPPA